jgi:hypothetical protein
MSRMIFGTAVCGLIVVAGLTGLARAEALSSETRTLGAFDRIDVAAGVDVTVVCGNVAQAEVTTDSGKLDELKTELQGHTLSIHRESGFHMNFFAMGTHVAKVRLTVGNPLTEVAVSSGASARLPACGVSPQSLRLGASSGGHLQVAGKTRELSAEASSGGHIEPFGGDPLDGEKTDAAASSGGHVRLCDTQILHAAASSGGHISAPARNHATWQRVQAVRSTSRSANDARGGP